MSLSLVVVSNSPNGLRTLIEWGREQSYIDSVVAVADSDSPFDLRKEAKTADRYEFWPVSGRIESVLAEAYRLPDTDWILRLDDDERLGSFAPRIVAQALRNGCDFFDFPRYNLWQDEHHFLPEGALYPDTQRRLFRRGHVSHGGELHEGGTGHGRFGGLLDTHIFHFKFLWKRREERHHQLDVYHALGADPYFDQFTLPEAQGYLAIAEVKEPYA